MRNSRTSKKQIETFRILRRFVENKIIKAGGTAIQSEDKLEGYTNNMEIYLELEKRIPGTKYSADILLTIKSKKTGKTKDYAIEYDCLQWHRKWNDEKKNDALVALNINPIRIQTFDLQPNPNVLWKFIKQIWEEDEAKVMYYQLPDYIDDIWTGKLFLYYR